MTTTLEPPTAIDNETISRLISEHVAGLEHLDTQPESADEAFELALYDDAVAFSKLLDKDDVYAAALLGFGIRLGVVASQAVLQQPAPQAQETIRHALAEIRNDIRDRIAGARKAS